MSYLPGLTTLYLPDELLADNGDAYNIHVIENESLLQNKKLFAYKPLEADPEYITKVLTESTDKEVTHLKFQYTHFNGTVEDWEKGLDGENLEGAASRINSSIKHLDISECTFEDPNFIWPLMKSMCELSSMKSDKLKMILRKDQTLEFIYETPTADPKFLLKSIIEANKKKIVRIKFIRTNFKGNAKEWKEVFEAENE